MPVISDSGMMPAATKRARLEGYIIHAPLVERWTIRNRVDYQPPTLRQPYGVHMTDDHVITAEGLWPHSRLHLFSHHGKSSKVIGQGQVLPYDVTTSESGDLVFTDHLDKTVKCLAPDGTVRWSWDNRKFVWPNGIARNRDGSYVVGDWSRGEIHICDQDGRSKFTFSTKTEDSIPSFPDYLCIDIENRIIVTDSFNRNVKAFSHEGQLLFNIGNHHDHGNSPLLPKGVATDANNNIFIADWEADSIKMYTPHGSWIQDIVGPNQVKHPLAVDVHQDKLVVTQHKLNTSPSMKLFQL